MIEFFEKYRIFGFASIAGVVISIIGFCVIIKNVLRTKRLVTEATKDIKRIDTVQELSTALMAMKEIKDMNLRKDFDKLPRRCSALKEKLITIRTVYPNFTKEQQTTIQRSITAFNRMEQGLLVKAQEGELPDDIPVRNQQISKQIDDLQVVLITIKGQIGRG